MIDKQPPHLELIGNAVSDDPFDLSKLRINPENIEGTSVKKLVTTIPVRKPGNQDFVRVRPEPTFREDIGVHRIEGRTRNLHCRLGRGA